MTKNSKHPVRTICSHMKNKSVKLPFVTKNSKHLVGTSDDDDVMTMVTLSMNTRYTKQRRRRSRN